MRIIKCDLCKKKIKGEPITAGIGFFPKAELCQKCGSPILKFLSKNKFIERNKIKKA
jgi:hypothetical protein